MKKKILLFSLSIFTIILISQKISYALNAKQIIMASQEAIRGKSQISISVITIKTRRWTRKLKIKSWENRRQKKSFSEILAPSKDAGNRFLLIRKTMRHFIPKLQKVIKISPSMMLQAWMGSDFTNDDIVKESSKIEDYTHTILGKKTINNDLCYKIMLNPKAETAVVWGKIIYYARVKDNLPAREEYYNERNELKKVLSFSKFKKLGGRIIPTLYKMQTISKKNRYTLMEIKNARFNVKISRKTFTLQNLKRK